MEIVGKMFRFDFDRGPNIQYCRLQKKDNKLCWAVCRLDSQDKKFMPFIGMSVGGNGMDNGDLFPYSRHRLWLGYRPLLIALYLFLKTALSVTVLGFIGWAILWGLHATYEYSGPIGTTFYALFFALFVPLYLAIKWLPL